MPSRAKYGLMWPEEIDDAQIECHMIKKGGEWTDKGRTYGLGLYHHFYQLFRLYWPHEDEHKWEKEILKAILSNQFAVLMGSSGSTKTSTAAKFALAFYSVWPVGTTILVSSTDMRGLELRVFGRMKELMKHAKDRYWWFPGNVIDSKKTISTDSLDEGEIRDLRDGIICIPCLSSTGSWVGLGKWIGIHNKRVLFVGDEFQLMMLSILDAIPNLINNPYSKFVFLGNPLAQNDPLDKVSEPAAGWGSVGVPKKTTTWKNKYMNGVTLALPGLDSPNFDLPEGTPDKYPYMVGRERERMIRESYGEGSQQYCSMILGVRVEGLTARKVITREICEKFDAFKKPIWESDERELVYAIDAAYGSIGGDLCIGGYAEFGRNVSGKTVFCLGPQKTIPVSALSASPPDDQIALWVKDECEELGIPPQNVFFDGRTMLMSAFARLWSDKVNPIDFGALTTDRPVSLDMRIQDEQTGQLRLKKCSEHYSKFVTELWFSIRYTIESGQFCGMTDDILNDAMPREWKTVRGNKVEVESKKEMKKRTGKSPDRTDQVATALEGARRLGFQIAKLAIPDKKDGEKSLLQRLAKEQDDFLKKRMINA
jgi:hypothetical protein